MRSFSRLGWRRIRSASDARRVSDSRSLWVASSLSGDLNDYWRVLWETGKLTRDMLGKFQSPITVTPQFLPHIANDKLLLLYVFSVSHIYLAWCF